MSARSASRTGAACSLALLALVLCGCAGSGRVARSEPVATPPANGPSLERAAPETRRSRKRSREERAAAPAVPQAAASDAAPVSAAAAEAGWRERIAREPGDAAALTRLSRLLYEQGRHGEAVALLAPVRDGQVKLPAADRSASLAGLAMHEAALGRDAEALSVLSTLPDGAAPSVAAYLAVRGGAADSALAATERALREAPESAALHNNRGIALLRAGQADAAQREFERAIALDPTRAGPYYNLAILERFYRLDTAAAQRWFQAYSARATADPDSLRSELGRGRPAPVAEGRNER